MRSACEDVAKMQRRLALLSLCLASREASSGIEEASEDLDLYGSVPWINTVGVSVTSSCRAAAPRTSIGNRRRWPALIAGGLASMLAGEPRLPLFCAKRAK